MLVSQWGVNNRTVDFIREVPSRDSTLPVECIGIFQRSLAVTLRCRSLSTYRDEKREERRGRLCSRWKGIRAIIQKQRYVSASLYLFHTEHKTTGRRWRRPRKRHEFVLCTPICSMENDNANETLVDLSCRESGMTEIVHWRERCETIMTDGMRWMMVMFTSRLRRMRWWWWWW